MIELEIYEAGEQDLPRIYQALSDLGVPHDPEETKLLQYSVGVFVAPGELGEALAAVHALGFATDED